MASDRVLRTVMVGNTPQAERRRDWRADEAPDPFREQRFLLANGVDEQLAELNRPPLNPLARKSPFWAGIDPARALHVMASRRNVDAVICVSENSALVMLALRRLFGFAPPIILQDVTERGWRPRDAVLDYAVPRAELVFSLTRGHARYVERSYRTKRPPRIIGCRIDEGFYRPDAEIPEASRRVGGYIFAIGHDHSRDYELLLEACRGIDMPLVLRTNLPVRVPDDMRARVEVIGTRISFREVRALYRQARLVAVPLRETDNAGGVTAALEAMAMAKPMVCTDTATTRDFVSHGEQALITPPGDAPAMRTAIERLLADPAMAAWMGRMGRRAMETVYSTASYAERRAGFIRDLVRETATANQAGR